MSTQRPSRETKYYRVVDQAARLEKRNYGGPIKLDLVRVKLAKEAKGKDQRIEELERNLEEQAQQLTHVVRILL